MTGHSKKFPCWLHYEAVKAGESPQTTAHEEWDFLVKGKEPEWIKGCRLKSIYKNRNPNVYLQPPAIPKDILSDPERLGLALYTGPMVCCSLTRMRPC